MTHKLVRDKIPSIIEAEGNDLHDYLVSKLLEALEFQAYPSDEELADVLEVVDALKALYPNAASVQKSKALLKGTFKEGWVMSDIKDVIQGIKKRSTV